MKHTAFTREVLEVYIQEDLKELDNPMRQDQRILLADLRYLFRAYWHRQKRPDWVPVAQ